MDGPTRTKICFDPRSLKIYWVAVYCNQSLFSLECLWSDTYILLSSNTKNTVWTFSFDQISSIHMNSKDTIEEQSERESSLLQRAKIYLFMYVTHILNLLLLHEYLVNTILIHSTSFFTYSIACKISLDCSWKMPASLIVLFVMKAHKYAPKNSIAV